MNKTTMDLCDGHVPFTNVMVDKFSARGDDVDHFLLTHPHTDHTAGLSATWDKGEIHCSHVCKLMLLLKFPQLSVVGHTVGSTFRLSTLESPARRGVREQHRPRVPSPDGGSERSLSLQLDEEPDSEEEWRQDPANQVEITLVDVDARHCPGSVMFLIRTPQATFLYTGDFRFHSDMLQDPHLASVCIDRLCVARASRCTRELAAHTQVRGLHVPAPQLLVPDAD